VDNSVTGRFLPLWRESHSARGSRRNESLPQRERTRKAGSSLSLPTPVQRSSLSLEMMWAMVMGFCSAPPVGDTRGVERLAKRKGPDTRRSLRRLGVPIGSTCYTDWSTNALQPFLIVEKRSTSVKWITFKTGRHSQRGPPDTRWSRYWDCETSSSLGDTAFLATSVEHGGPTGEHDPVDERKQGKE
jgi:hypothetical protein